MAEMSDAEKVVEAFFQTQEQLRNSLPGAEKSVDRETVKRDLMKVYESLSDAEKAEMMRRFQKVQEALGEFGAMIQRPPPTP